MAGLFFRGQISTALKGNWAIHILTKGGILYTPFYLILMSLDQPRVPSSARIFILISNPGKIDLHNAIFVVFANYAARRTRGPDFANPEYVNMIPFACTEKFITIIRDV